MKKVLSNIYAIAREIHEMFGCGMEFKVECDSQKVVLIFRSLGFMISLKDMKKIKDLLPDTDEIWFGKRVDRDNVAIEILYNYDKENSYAPL